MPTAKYLNHLLLFVVGLVTDDSPLMPKYPKYTDSLPIKQELAHYMWKYVSADMYVHKREKFL
jgi:hypothetical protein